MNACKEPPAIPLLLEEMDNKEEEADRSLHVETGSCLTERCDMGTWALCRLLACSSLAFGSAVHPICSLCASIAPALSPLRGLILLSPL